MKKTALVSLVAAGLALIPMSGVFAATNPAAPNPTPARESKPLVDFGSAVTATSDPAAAGTNLATLNTDPQFIAAGSKSLKVDLTNLPSGGWADPFVVIKLPQPVDIQGYQMLTMDVYTPLASLNPDSTNGGWYQMYPLLPVTNPNDPTMTTNRQLPMRNMKIQEGWNHLVWDIPSGVDTKISTVAFATGTNGSRPYTGPIYLDNIRVYKGSFAGLQPDEKLIAGFDNSTDASLFTANGATGISVNTNKQFISQGAGSLAIDLAGQASGYVYDVATAMDLGVSVDVSKATALHLDLFAPTDSVPAPGNNGWHQLGYRVIGSGGTVDGEVGVGELLDGQWNTFEIALTADQATMLGNVKGIQFARNSGDAWRGPVYADALRAVFPTAPAAGQ